MSAKNQDKKSHHPGVARSGKKERKLARFSEIYTTLYAKPLMVPVLVLYTGSTVYTYSVKVYTITVPV
jgi:hypothetical protein